MLRGDDIAAVIFDMDGLVLDTEKTYRMAWRKAGQAMRYDFTDAFLDALSGLSSDAVAHHIESYCGSGFDASEFNRLSAGYWRDHVSS